MSDDYVFDASALVLALIGKTDAADALRQRLPMMRGHAPHLIDADLGNVLRRHEQSGRISAQEAQSALRAGGALIEHRYAPPKDIQPALKPSGAGSSVMVTVLLYPWDEPDSSTWSGTGRSSTGQTRTARQEKPSGGYRGGPPPG